MRWIILALTFGASITSIIHGVFMLFESLPAATIAPGLPQTFIASIPVISAILALTGGIIAFNYSKWGALFLFFATGVCIPAGRDIWLYGGIYFFAAVLCFFLKRPQEYPQENYDYDYEESEDFPSNDLSYETLTEEQQDFQNFNINLNRDLESHASEYPGESESNNNLNAPAEDIYNVPDIKPVINSEVNLNPAPPTYDFDSIPEKIPTPKIKRRTSKSCPACGAIVARDDKYCSTCGTALHVVEEEPFYTGTAEELVPPERANNNFAGDNNFNNDKNLYGGEDKYNMRDSNSNSRNITAYRNFSKSKYTRNGKKPKKSSWHKIIQIIILISAVTAASYLLLNMRKLKPGELTPMINPELTQNNNPQIPSTSPENNSSGSNNIVAQPIAQPAIRDNSLPDLIPNPNPSVGVITGNGVNLRSEATTNSRAVTKLSNNTRVEILSSVAGNAGAKSGTWYQIRTNNNREGWVFGDYLRTTGANLPSGYANALLKSLGSNRAELIESLGQPIRSTGSSIEWQGLSAGLRGDEITRLVLNDARYELQNGLKTGMMRDEVINILGYPTSQNVGQRTMQYNENNKAAISIQNDRNGSVTRITVNNIN